MIRLAEIEAHISGMGELQNIVGAMRSLAGMRMQEAQRTLPGIRRYAESVAGGIADTLLLLGDPGTFPDNDQGPVALLLYTAEHGFVGGFNERLFEAAQELLRPDDLLFVLGSRGAAFALERGRPANWTHSMATRAAAVPKMIQTLSNELYRRIEQGEIARVEVMHTRYRKAAAASIERILLLPLDVTSLRAKQIRQPPLHNLDPVALHEKLMAEYVFALLAEAAAESIASENAARLAAMESAHDNVSRRLDRLCHDARQARQSEITTEILELAAAAMALGGE